MLKCIFLTACLHVLLGVAITVLPRVVYAQNLANIEGNQIDYLEGEGEVQITESITVSGDVPISYAIVEINTGYDPEEDTLVFKGEENVYPLFDEEAGRLFLLSYPAETTRSSAEMQAALRSVFYRNTDEASPRRRSRRITFTVYNQSDAASNTVSRSIAVRGENDPPVLRSPSNDPVVVNSLVQAVPVAEDLQVIDVDDNIIAGATVDIALSRFSDQLIFNDDRDDNIRIQRVEGSNSELILSGEDTRANYQEALRSISISNIFTARGFKGNRRVDMQITDRGGAESNVFSQFIQVADPDNPVNVPPSVKDISVSTEENQPVEFQLQQFLSSYSDAENSRLDFIRILSLPAHGVLTLDGVVIDADYIVNDNGVVDRNDLDELEYIPNQGFSGSDKFEWNATDGTEFAANPANVDIVVTLPVTPLSLAIPDNAQVDEDGTTVLPPIIVEASASLPLEVELSVESGQLFLSSVVTPFINGLDTEDSSKLAFSGTAQAVRYLLSGLQYRPNTDVTGSDLLDITVASPNENEEGVLAITIIPIDDPIVLSNIEADTAIYIENSPAVTITNEITLSDPDGATVVKSAVVSVSEGITEEDMLSYTLTGGVTAQQSENQLVFTGEGSLSQYQTILRSVAYENLSEDPQVTFLTFAFQATDENDSISNTVFRTLRVVPADDSTVLTTAEPELLNYVLGSGLTPVYSTITLTDTDSDSLTQLTASFEAGYDPNLDTLVVAIPEGMEVNWNDEEGTLVVTGKNSLQAYQTIIRSLRYQFSSGEPQPNRQLILQVFNDVTPSNIVPRTIQLVANEPPLISSFEKKVAQSSLLAFSVEDFLVNYSDPDDFPNPDQFSSLRVVSLPEQGILTVADDTITSSEVDPLTGGFFINAENITQFSYHPNPDYIGEDSFSWNAFDGAQLATDSALVSLSIVPALAISIPDSLEVCPGETKELLVEVVSGEEPYTYSWSCDRDDCRINSAVNGPAISIAPVETTNYIIWVESAEGLDNVRDTISVTVKDCSGIPLEIPSAFTPNGDGINDQWTFPNAIIFPSIQVSVYNRYGRTVFESNNYQNNWSGTYEGEKLPVGTYYYTIVVNERQNEEVQEYTGTVTLLQ